MAFGRDGTYTCTCAGDQFHGRGFDLWRPQDCVLYRDDVGLDIDARELALPDPVIPTSERTGGRRTAGGPGSGSPTRREAR